LSPSLHFTNSPVTSWDSIECPQTLDALPPPFERSALNLRHGLRVFRPISDWLNSANTEIWHHFLKGNPSSHWTSLSGNMWRTGFRLAPYDAINSKITLCA
jgi:hypothetical protein